MAATNPEQIILSKTYPTSGYNLAYISRQARLLAGGFFCRKATKVIPYFQYFSLRLYMNSINSNLIFAGINYSKHGGAIQISHCVQDYIYIYIYINNLHSNSLLRCSKEIKALITARHGESIRFNLARWT